jgi:L-lactate dehydrogenase complex protein LldE
MTAAGGGGVEPGSRASRVQLFPTCLVEALRPEVGWATVAVLERIGLTVEVPEGLTCCGQPAFNAGAWDDARAMAGHTLDVLEATPQQDPVVVPSGSCAHMIVHGYPELFADDPRQRARAEALAHRTFELTQLLTESPGAAQLEARWPGPVAYHPSCHLLRGLGLRGGPERLLDAVEGADRVELPGAEECCGFGGLFAVKLHAISGAMLQRKLDAIETCGATTVVSCDVSCLTQIEGGLRRRGSRVRACHLAEVLAGR